MMQINDVQTLWDQQPTPRPQQTATEIVQRSRRRSAINAVAMLAFFLLSMAMAGHTFWFSFGSQGEALGIALIRCSLFVILAGVQYPLWRQARREADRRESCQLAPGDCLREIQVDLEREIASFSPLRSSVPLLLIMVFISLNKWIDYRLGVDTLAECIGIVIAAGGVFGLVGVTFWHYRTQFLEPRRSHIRQTLAELGTAKR
ncbi:MAG: hypothetical protein AAGA23_00935 [Pseudomonadota bacterium]